MATDIKTPTLQQTKPADPSVIAAEVKAEKSSTSRGEKLFDWLTYGGIAFAGVFLATMPWTYWNKYGGGKKIQEWLTKNLKSHGASDAFAEQTHNTLVLGAIGNAAIVPVKIMENYKPKLVEKFNEMLGDKSEDASVDNDPKQTWTSLILGRVAAYAAVFFSLQGAVSAFGGKAFKDFEEKFAMNMVVKPLGYTRFKPGMEQIAANETKAFRYGKIAALDVFATAAATILLYAGSRFFAKKNDKWHAHHTHIDPVASTPSVAPFTNHPEPAKPAEPAHMESKALDTALAAPTDKLHANTVTPRHYEPVRRTRKETFAGDIADQKALASETPLGLSV